ncbi:MAG: hypothetical protein IJM35_01015 [Bacteroidales bacterium]|nr:hypothetical protein [Bacteroidales bacterium]
MNRKSTLYKGKGYEAPSLVVRDLMLDASFCFSQLEPIVYDDGEEKEF